MEEDVTYDFGYYHPQNTPEFYYPNEEVDAEALTPAEKLDLIGRTQVVTSMSMFGAIPVQVAESVTDNYKREARYMATQEEQIDVKGLGYQYSALDAEFTP